MQQIGPCHEGRQEASNSPNNSRVHANIVMLTSRKPAELTSSSAMNSMETGLLDRPLPPFETLGTTPSPDRKSIAEDAETDAEVAIEFEVTEQKERGQRLDARS